MAGKPITSPELISSHPAPELVRTMFPPGMKAGPFVFVSGSAAKDMSLDCQGQTDQVFQYISQVLTEAGYSMRDVVKVHGYVSNVEDYPAYNEVRHKFFPQDPPASTALVADFVLPGMLVEVDVIAYKE